MKLVGCKKTNFMSFSTSSNSMLDRYKRIKWYCKHIDFCRENGINFLLDAFIDNIPIVKVIFGPVKKVVNTTCECMKWMKQNFKVV